MKQIYNANPTESGNQYPPVVAYATRRAPLEFVSEFSQMQDSASAVETDSCAPFERIGVKTRHSFYEVIVLTGHRGEVLIRGGRYFSEFQRARLAGSTAGGSALKPRTIQVGLRMELILGGETISTSTVLALSREAFNPLTLR
jgi:hypothetical protein